MKDQRRSAKYFDGNVDRDKMEILDFRYVFATSVNLFHYRLLVYCNECFLDDVCRCISDCDNSDRVLYLPVE